MPLGKDISGGLVSVVIPCFNQAHFLHEAIESVAAQSYLLHEIIVVDDGSTDNTATVAASYPRVRCVRQRNQGLAAARNTGFLESTGEFLVFLDADDLLLPEALEIGLKYLNEHPECGFVAGWCKWIAEDGSPLETPERTWLGMDDYYGKLLTCNNMGGIMTAMFRRSVLDAVGGFDPSRRRSEDYDLYFRITRKFPVYCHGEPVALYRRHGATLSRDSGAMLRSSLSVLSSQRGYIKGNRAYEEAYKSGVRFWQNCYGGRLVEQVRANAREGAWIKAIRGMSTLVRYHPRAFFENADRKLRRMVNRSGHDG
jgi:glycosyltransferase involved in cell wall biosynthesis